MAIQGRKLYASSSGDSWYLCRGRNGEVLVSHEPNVASGGKEQLIGELVNPDYKPAEQFDDHE
jgi:hypothetical protein